MFSYLHCQANFIHVLDMFLEQITMVELKGYVRITFMPFNL